MLKLVCNKILSNSLKVFMIGELSSNITAEKCIRISFWFVQNKKINF